jgi:CBS domain-containing protein
MGNTTSTQLHGRAGQQSGLGDCLVRASKRIKVGDLMNREVVTITSRDTLRDAVKAMAEDHLSCLPVVDAGVLKGILTQKHALKEIAEGTEGFDSALVGQCMQVEVHTVDLATSVFDAGRIMEGANVKSLVVLSEARVVGVVTQSDATGALTSLLEVTQVHGVMTGDVTTVDAAATVLEALRIMTEAGISCAVAMHGAKVVGILTEKDLLTRVMAADRDPRETLVADVMSFPVMSIAPTDCIFNARRLMDRKHTHRVLVMEGDQVCGIVTQTDILRALKDLVLQEQAH